MSILGHLRNSPRRRYRDLEADGGMQRSHGSQFIPTPPPSLLPSKDSLTLTAVPVLTPILDLRIEPTSHELQVPLLGSIRDHLLRYYCTLIFGLPCGIAWW